MESQDKDSQGQEQVKTEGATEEKKTEIYTQEQVSKIQSTFEKKWRDADNRAAKSEKALNDATQKYSTLEDKITVLEREREKQMFSGLEDLPQTEKLKSLYDQVAKARDDILKQQRDLNKIQGEAYEGLKFKDAIKVSKEIKTQYGVEVDPDDLMDVASYAEMQNKAKDKVLESLKEVKPKEKEKILPDKVDSGVSSPSSIGRMWKQSELAAMDSNKRFELRKEIAKAFKEGRIDPYK